MKNTKINNYLMATVIGFVSAVIGVDAYAWDAGPDDCIHDVCSRDNVLASVVDLQYRANTHLYIVEQALELLKNDSSALANAAYEKMNDADCKKSWQEGVWKADAKEHNELKKPGTHFYNPTDTDWRGHATDSETYTLGRSFKIFNWLFETTVSIDAHGSARENAHEKIGVFLENENNKKECEELGLALHYVADATQPMHVKGFSTLHFPLAQHTALEVYAGYVQADYVASTWNNVWEGALSDDVFYNVAERTATYADDLKMALSFLGTACDSDDFGRNNYFSDCFLNNPTVKETVGNILEVSFESVASYIYAIYEEQAIDRVLGEYTRSPVTNSWHTGTIERTNNGLQWRNEAGVSWALTLDVENRVLLTGPDCPYFNNASGNGKSFILVENGDQVTGFTFQGEQYFLNK